MDYGNGNVLKNLLIVSFVNFSCFNDISGNVFYCGGKNNYIKVGVELNYDGDEGKIVYRLFY